MVIQVEVMQLHMMRTVNDARRLRGALMAPILKLLSATTEGTLSSSDASSRIRPTKIGHLGTFLCVYAFFCCCWMLLNHIDFLKLCKGDGSEEE
jgi:hypothetical protein